MNVLDFIAGKRLLRGVHVPEHKEQTSGLAIRRLPFAPRLVVPLSQHAGAPSVAIVREGQEVVRGEPIAKAGGFVSVPMHAPVTGKVEKIALAPSAKGELTPAIYLRTYASASQEVLYGEPRNILQMSRDELIAAVQETGVVGLGGAAFPTHVKLKTPEGKQVDTLIVNGCECEPYLTADHRVMLEHAESVIKGTRIVMRALGAQRAIIGVEDNKLDAVTALKRVNLDAADITIELVEAKYPQGAEKMLANVLVHRQIPSGGLPADVGLAVFNVATLAQIGELLPNRQGLIERVVTIAGSGVTKPGNYLIPIGTPLRFALEFAGCTPETSAVVLGGPMMGAAIGSFDIPFTKGVTGVIAMKREANGRVFPCIHCAACVNICPMQLNPSQLGLLARKQRYEEMASDYHLMDCFECGCCSYVCPAHIPLVQQFRVAKQLIRERKAAARV